MRARILAGLSWLLILMSWLYSLVKGQGRRFFLVRDPSSYGLGLCTFGVKRSGKTTVILKILGQAWMRGEAVIAVDTGDCLYERALNLSPPGTPVYRYNVIRKDGYGVDFANVMDTYPRILQVADKFFQGKPGDRNEFWQSNGKAYFIAGVQALNHFAPGRWVPMDLISLLFNRDLFDAVCAETKGKVPNPLLILGRGQAAHDVAGTVQAALLPIVSYAALCDHLPLHNPLEVARTRHGTIICEWVDAVSAANERMFAVVLDACGEVGISATAPAKTLWFNADEIRSLVRMNFMVPMALRGRRAKCNLLMSVHEVDGMYDRYGTHAGKEILGVLGIKVFLRLGGSSTVTFAADTFSKIEYLRGVRKHDPNLFVGHEQQRRDDVSWSVVERYVIDPSEFLTIPYPDVDNDRLVGAAISPDHRGWFTTHFVKETTPPNPIPGDPCPPEWFTPRFRGEADMLRLGIRPTTAILDALQGRRRP